MFIFEYFFFENSLKLNPGSSSVLCLHIMQVTPRLTLGSGTFFHGKSFPLPLIQEGKVVGYLRKNGH